MCPFFFDFRRKCPTVGFERASWKCESGLITVAMLGVVKHCIACLPKSMEDALFIHEVLQRNGHRNRGRRC